METEWRVIEKYPKYEVSVLGIRLIGSDRLKALSFNTKGYLRTWLKKEGIKNPYNNGHKRPTGLKRFWMPYHRAIAEAFIPNPENKPQVNHKNGIKSDNRIENLEWATAAENVIHAVINGLMRPPQGENAGLAKLSNEDAIEIVRLWEFERMNKTEISKLYPLVGRSVIYSITNRKTWVKITSHIPVLNPNRGWGARKI